MILSRWPLDGVTRSFCRRAALFSHAARTISGNQVNQVLRKSDYKKIKYIQILETFLDQSKINNLNLVKDAASSRRRTALEFSGNLRRARFFFSLINRWKSFWLGQQESLKNFFSIYSCLKHKYVTIVYLSDKKIFQAYISSHGQLLRIEESVPGPTLLTDLSKHHICRLGILQVYLTVKLKPHIQGAFDGTEKGSVLYNIVYIHFT